MRSSGVEHFLDAEGVSGSNPLAPTIFIFEWKNVSGREALKAISRDGEIFEVANGEEALEILRHSTSHLMALAVMELYPEVHLGFVPQEDAGELLPPICSCDGGVGWNACAFEVVGG